LRTSVSRFERKVVQQPPSDGRTLSTGCQELLHPQTLHNNNNYDNLYGAVTRPYRYKDYTFILSNNSD